MRGIPLPQPWVGCAARTIARMRRRGGSIDSRTGWAVGLLTASKLVLNSGFRFVYPFLPALGRGLGVDLQQMGLVLSVRWGVGFTAPIAVRAVAPRGQSRRLLITGLAVFAFGSFVTAVSGVFVGAIIGFAFMGLGKPLFDIGAQTHVSERVPYARRGRVLGILEMSWAGGFLIGAPVAGWLIDRGGWDLPFWTVGSAALLLVGVVGWLFAGAAASTANGATGTDRPWSQSLVFLITVAASAAALEIVLVTMGAWLEGAFGLTLAALAGVGSLIGVAELTGEGLMVAFIDRIGKRNAFALALSTAAAALVVLSFVSDRAGPSLFAMFVVMMTLELAVISAIPLASEFRPSNRSRFLSWWLVAGGIGRIFADLVSPRLYETSGMPMVSRVAAVTALMGAALLMIGVRELE